MYGRVMGHVANLQFIVSVGASGSKACSEDMAVNETFTLDMPEIGESIEAVLRVIHRAADTVKRHKQSVRPNGTVRTRVDVPSATDELCHSMQAVLDAVIGDHYGYSVASIQQVGHHIDNFVAVAKTLLGKIAVTKLIIAHCPDSDLTNDALFGSALMEFDESLRTLRALYTRMV